MILIWLLFLILITVCFSNLLLMLLILEMISFIVIYFVATVSLSLVITDFLVITLFSVFVIEGVIGIAGLILLVSHTGSDYLSSSSLSKC